MIGELLTQVLLVEKYQQRHEIFILWKKVWLIM